MLEKCTIPRQKFETKSWWGALPSPHTPALLGRGHTIPKVHPLVPAAPRHWRLRPWTCAPHSKILDPPLVCSYFPASSSLLIHYLYLSLIHNIIGLGLPMFIKTTIRQHISIYSIGPYWYCLLVPHIWRSGGTRKFCRSYRSRIPFCTPP